jgi:methylated-DNA-[protein]-cysteine S-methyltransferase
LSKKIEMDFPGSIPDPGTLKEAAREIRMYLNGKLEKFESRVELHAAGKFELRCLKAASKIPYGGVRTYGWVAAKAGSPKAARAAGNAMMRNPIPLIIPCHRVVRGDGRTGNYSGGGPGAKRMLLDLERRSLPTLPISKK